jgi:hypothetical protein
MINNLKEQRKDITNNLVIRKSNELNPSNFSELSIESILSLDKNTKIYRPQLRTITGSVTAALLLSQIIYWFYKNKCKPFYKFKEKCDNQYYKDGDDWCTELCFTNREFDGALKKISSRIKKGQPKNLQSLVWYWTTSERMTYYEVNVKLLEKELINVYGLSNKTIKLNDKSADTYLNDKSADRYLNDKSADTYITQTTAKNTSNIIKKLSNDKTVLVENTKNTVYTTEQLKVINEVKEIFKNQFGTIQFYRNSNKSIVEIIKHLEANLKAYNDTNNIKVNITLKPTYKALETILKVIAKRIKPTDTDKHNLNYFKTIILTEPPKTYIDDTNKLLSMIDSEQKANYYKIAARDGASIATEKLRNLLIKTNKI